jgi:hypothetical protein
MSKRADGVIRAFGMSGLQMVAELNSIDSRYGISLGHLGDVKKSRKASEYEQFESDLRAQAARMSEFYEVFYCLENSIRRLVKGVLYDAAGPNWWDSDRVDENNIRKTAKARQKKELDSGISVRSEELIDYTTFGELSQLITDNMDIFDTVFSSKLAVSNITNHLNLLRGPIAHCNPTDELEQDRLNLAVKSWFRLLS